MIKKLLLILLLFNVTGCAVMEMDLTLVDPTDEIDRNEAILIAQLNLGDSAFKNSMDFGKARILNSASAQQFPDTWFVAFPPKWMYFFSRNNYCVAVSKSSGQVYFANVVSPQKLSDVSWYSEIISK